MGADRLEDPDYPGHTTGRAAEVLDVQQAFLRALDTAGAVIPQRAVTARLRRQLRHERDYRQGPSEEDNAEGQAVGARRGDRGGSAA